MMWQKGEIECLKRDFSTNSDTYLAGLLSRSPNSIRIQASRLALRKESSKIRETLELTSIEEQVIIGGLLGDLHCRKTRTSKNARLEGGHGLKQEEYMIWKKNILKRLNFTVRKSKQDSWLYQSKSFACLNKYHHLFYERGFKSINREVLGLLDTFGLLIWYLDDGTYDRRDKSITIYTNCFKFKEQMMMKEWFASKFGIEPKIRKLINRHGGEPYFCLRFNTKDTNNLVN
ncbi:MAG: hypothetical protein KJ574_01930, partial [Nanoarchaeota archaeon]|nr:hypothetical protein [Nanoarchaeota archaeon]